MKNWLGLALVLAAVLAAWFLLPVQAWMQAFSAWIEAQGAWGVLIYGAAYAAALVIMAPAAPFTLGAGLIYGFWGFPLAWASATAGAALAFLVSRHLVRGRIAGVIASRPALRAMDRAVAEEGWRVVGLLRLSPLVPFNLQNYALGATSVGFWPYVAATAAGIAPGCLLYVYFGVLGKASLGDGGNGAGGALKWAFVALGLAATVAMAVLVGRKARAVLAHKGVDAGG